MAIAPARLTKRLIHFGQLEDGADEVLDINGLRQMHLKAGLECASPIVFPSQGGERERRDFPAVCRIERPYFANERMAILARHRDI